MNEIWKQIPGYEGIYEASSIGAIRRIAGWTDGRKTAVKGLRKIKLAKYSRITLFANREKREHAVHRLVYEAFRGKMPTGLEINHINGNKHDNRIENLEAVNHSENKIHSYRVLGAKTRPGSKHPMAKLTESMVEQIRLLRRDGMPLEEIAERYNVSAPTISLIANRKIWRHI